MDNVTENSNTFDVSIFW